MGYPVGVSLSLRLKLFGSPIRWLCGRPINGPSEPHSAHEISAHQNLLCNALSALLQITAYDYPFDIFQILYAILLYIHFE